MKYEETKEELQELVKLGAKLYNALRENESKPKQSQDLQFFLSNYEVWYSKATAAVKQFLPDRISDFSLLYRNDKRKELSFSTYTISDAMRTTTHYNKIYGPWSAALCVARQVNMLQSCLETFDSKIYNIQVILQADIFDSELESAKHLLKMGFLRAAGAICGVVLEKHLLSVCNNRNIFLRKKAPSIADYNEALKDVAYDTIEWRKVQRLADIRNLCDHSKGREPTKDEVEELISGAERVTKTIF